MRRSFLSYNYERTLYNKLQNLRQGSRTVEDYANDLFQISARTPTVETEEQLVSRFIGGLRSQLQNALQQFNPTSVSEAHQRALGMKQQFKGNWSTGTARTRSTSTWQNNQTTTHAVYNTTTPGTRDKNVSNDSNATNHKPRTNALRCFTCGEHGHRSTACPKQNRRGLLTQD